MPTRVKAGGEGGPGEEPAKEIGRWRKRDLTDLGCNRPRSVKYILLSLCRPPDRQGDRAISPSVRPDPASSRTPPPAGPRAIGRDRRSPFGAGRRSARVSDPATAGTDRSPPDRSARCPTGRPVSQVVALPRSRVRRRFGRSNHRGTEAQRIHREIPHRRTIWRAERACDIESNRGGQETEPGRGGKSRGPHHRPVDPRGSSSLLVFPLCLGASVVRSSLRVAPAMRFPRPGDLSVKPPAGSETRAKHTVVRPGPICPMRSGRVRRGPRSVEFGPTAVDYPCVAPLARGMASRPRPFSRGMRARTGPAGRAPAARRPASRRGRIGPVGLAAGRAGRGRVGPGRGDRADRVRSSVGLGRGVEIDRRPPFAAYLPVRPPGPSCRYRGPDEARCTCCTGCICCICVLGFGGGEDPP